MKAEVINKMTQCKMLRSSIEGQSEVEAVALQNYYNKVQFRHMVNSEAGLSMFELDLP